MRVAGIDIGGTSVKLGIYAPGQGLLHTEQAPSPYGDTTEMARVIAGLLARHRPVDMVGVGTAGSVDQRSGLVSASNLGWRNVPLRAHIEAATGLSVWVDNDAQAALMAEWHDGACKGVETAVYLTLGTGIGGALILDGKPWRGHTNTAVEIGHMITHPNGLQCACGRRGCFELYASARALSALGGGATPEQVIAGARAGDAAMQAAFDTYTEELAYGLTTLVVIFRPQAIVLGGGISGAGDMLVQGVQRALGQHFTRRPEAADSILHLAQHRNDAGMIGAAILAMHHLGGDGA